MHRMRFKFPFGIERLKERTGLNRVRTSFISFSNTH